MTTTKEFMLIVAIALQVVSIVLVLTERDVATASVSSSLSILIIAGVVWPRKEETPLEKKIREDIDMW